jgi:Arc/MetJ-type ribon-helix-helix transcriptional regulator
MGIIVRMTKAKVTVTMDKDLLAKVKRAVDEGRAPSVSAYVEQAVAQWAIDEGTDSEFIDEMLDRSGGPLTEEESEQIDRRFGCA